MAQQKDCTEPKKQVRFSDLVSIRQIEEDEERRNPFYVKPKRIPKFVKTCIYLEMDLYKRFNMHVHPKSEKNTLYCLLPKLEAEEGRLYTVGDIPGLLIRYGIPHDWAASIVEHQCRKYGESYYTSTTEHMSLDCKQVKLFWSDLFKWWRNITQLITKDKLWRIFLSFLD